MHELRCILLSGLLALAVVLGPAGVIAKQVPVDPYGAHSMVYSTAPYAFKREMFRQAAAMGMRDLRADLALAHVITDAAGGRDWRPLDQYTALARRYRMRVTLVLLATPWWEAAPPNLEIPFSELGRCAARDPGQWAAWAGEIARRCRGTIDHFEIVNEPDAAFLGTPQQYAQTLVAAHRAIKAANPRATVLLGGISRPVSHGWIGAVLAAPGVAGSFDVANVHVRGTLRSVRRQVAGWKEFFVSNGFTGPLWVTEHGYPSAAEYQVDRAFRGGRRAQARYLRRSLPAIIGAGASKVFVSERDNLAGWFATEGLLGGSVADPPSADPLVIRKPAFYALRTMIDTAARCTP